MLITVIISVIATVFVINYYLFPKQLEPVELSQREESKLNQKLKHFGLPELASSSENNSNALTARAIFRSGR